MLEQIYLIAREYRENSGSYANYVEEVARYAHSKGHAVTILCGDGKEKAGKEVTNYAVIDRFPLPKRKMPVLGMNLDYFSLSFSVRSYFKKNPQGRKNYIIIANGRAALGVLRQRYVMRAGQPAFTFLHNMELAKEQVSLKTRAARFLHFSIQAVPEFLCARFASAYLFPSQETRDLWRKQYGMNRKPTFIPFAGVKFEKLSGGKPLPMEGRTLLFISAGGEKVRKGVVTLEQALPDIFERYPDVKLIHIGDKMDWSIPEKFRDRIISTGRVSWSQMSDYYATADVMVSTALSEGFPNIILEAMAAGKAIVTSDINGITDYITDGKEGLIYKRGDVTGLKKALSYMLDNVKQREQMGKAAREKISAIDYPVYLGTLMSFLDELSEGRRPQPVNLLKPDS